MQNDKKSHFQKYLKLSLFLAVMTFFLPTFGQAADSCSYPDDVSMDKKQRDCSSDKSREWICRLNRCVTTGEAQVEREKFKECAEKTDEAERKTCHDAYASNESGVSAGDSGSSSTGNLGMLGATVTTVYAGLALYSAQGAIVDGNTCLSRKVFLGGSVLMVVTEIYMKLMAEKKFGKIADKYNKEQLNEDAYDAQLKALEYLKEEQNEVAKLAKTRKNAYTLQMVAYTAATVLALLESNSVMAVCNFTGAATGIGSAGYVFLTTSPQVAVASGVAFGWAWFLRSKAQGQEDEAKENVTSIEGTITRFKDTMAGSSYCTPTARNDLENPQCYCYEKDGDRNMDRTNSNKCQALWAENDQNLMVGAAKYEGKVDPKMKVCMLVNGQVDKKCKCRQMINKTSGENACLKVPMGSNNLSAIGTALGLPGISSAIGNLANGNSSIGSLNGGSLNNQLAKTRKILKQTIGKINADRQNANLKPISLNTDKFSARALKRITPKQIASAASASLGSLSSNGRPTSGALAKSLAAAEQSSGISKKALLSGGSGLRSAGSSRKSGDNFAFLNSASGGDGKVMGGAPKKNYDYKDNDIVKNKGVSIWKVISSRYTKSAMRRLFGDNK
jgi:hypothetical protein